MSENQHVPGSITRPATTRADGTLNPAVEVDSQGRVVSQSPRKHGRGSAPSRDLLLRSLADGQKTSGQVKIWVEDHCGQTLSLSHIRRLMMAMKVEETVVISHVNGRTRTWGLTPGGELLAAEAVRCAAS